MAIAVGLDCGGTSTRAMALDDAGAIVYTGQAGAANWASTPREILESNLAAALAESPGADAVCACFAGLLTEDDAAQARNLLSRLSGCARTVAYPDTRAVLAAAGPEATAGVIAGTGSSIFSMVEGRLVRTGGGGPLLGDIGSAFGIARRAVAGWLAMGEIPESARDAVRRRYGTNDLSALVGEAYRQPSPAGFLAALAPDLVRLAEAGDAGCQNALAQEIELLADQIATHLRRFHPDQTQPKIALAGGVWEISPRIADNLNDALRLRLGPGVETIRLPQPPVWGAAQLARELLK